MRKIQTGSHSGCDFHWTTLAQTMLLAADSLMLYVPLCCPPLDYWHTTQVKRKVEERSESNLTNLVSCRNRNTFITDDDGEIAAEYREVTHDWLLRSTLNCDCRLRQTDVLLLCIARRNELVQFWKLGPSLAIALLSKPAHVKLEQQLFGGPNQSR